MSMGAEDRVRRRGGWCQSLPGPAGREPAFCCAAEMRFVVRCAELRAGQMLQLRLEQGGAVDAVCPRYRRDAPRPGVYPGCRVQSQPHAPRRGRRYRWNQQLARARQACREAARQAFSLQADAAAGEGGRRQPRAAGAGRAGRRRRRQGCPCRFEQVAQQAAAEVLAPTYGRWRWWRLLRQQEVEKTWPRHHNGR